MDKGAQKGHQEITHRVITMLNREELEFLDKLGKDSLFSTGHKLTYTEILEGLVALAMEMGLSGDKIDSKKTLEEKMYELIRRQVEAIKNNPGEKNTGGQNEKGTA